MKLLMYLNHDILKGFDKYKYSSRDTSPVSNYIMHPFWDWLVQFVPIWVAPNLMTFVGFLLTSFNFLLLAFLDPVYQASNINSSHHIPSYVWLLVAIFNFVAHQLDGIDGKQARRTGTSSPLGELFDHGCDSWVVSLLPLTLISLFGSDEYGSGSWEMFTVVWSMSICFILSHWEKYLTGILYLPWSYDIGQLGGTLFCLMTFFCSTDAWKINLHIVYPITVARLGIYCVMVSIIVFSFPMTLFNVVQSYRLNTGRMLSIAESVRPLVSTVILLIASLIWAVYSPNNMLTNHPRLFLFVIGTATSNITVKLIIAQMSQTRADLINPFAVAFVIVTVVVQVSIRFLFDWELILLWGLSVSFTVAHVLSAVFIVRELCTHLHIEAFNIAYKLQKSSSDNGKFGEQQKPRKEIHN